MSLMDVGYSSRPISVPPRLPIILKQFCKAAIRTQPYDLLKWSSAYFKALAEGIEPPSKARLEYPLPGTVSGLTLGFIKVLLRQFGDYNKIFSIESIIQRWDDLCLDKRDLNLIMIIGKFRHKCQIKKFLAIAVGLLGSSLYDTMLMICELFTIEPDGGSSMIPIGLFMEIYAYLARLQCDGKKRQETPDDVDNQIEFSSESTSEIKTPQVSVIFDDKIERNTSSTTSQDEDTITSPKDEVECFLNDEVIINDKLKDDNNCQFKTIENDLNKPTSDVIIEKTINIKKIDNSNDGIKLVCYPNVPGIGGCLSPEEIASVGVWMKECARLQDGMVGPRNLRHFHCPPLDRHETPYS